MVGHKFRTETMKFPSIPLFCTAQSTAPRLPPRALLTLLFLYSLMRKLQRKSNMIWPGFLARYQKRERLGCEKVVRGGVILVATRTELPPEMVFSEFMARLFFNTHEQFVLLD